MPAASDTQVSQNGHRAVLHCSKCDNVVHVKDSLAGMRAKCPECGHVGRITLTPVRRGKKAAEGEVRARRCPFCHEVLPDEVPDEAEGESAPSTKKGLQVGEPEAAVADHGNGQPAPEESSSDAAQAVTPAARKAESLSSHSGQVSASSAGGNGGPRGDSAPRHGHAPAKAHANGDDQAPHNGQGHYQPSKQEAKIDGPVALWARPESAGPSATQKKDKLLVGSPGDASRAGLQPKIRCPFCREEIFAESRKCRHCGEFLDEQLRWDRMRQKDGIPAGPKVALPSLGSLTSIPRWAKIGGICVLAAALLVGGYFVIRNPGHGGAPQAPTATDPFSHPGDAPVANSGVAAAGHSPSATLDSFAGSLRKILEASDSLDVAGNGTKFSDKSPGAAEWSTSVGKGRVASAKIELPYRSINNDPKQCGRGKLFLNLAMKDKLWVLTSVNREVWFQGPAGHEAEQEDRDAHAVNMGDPLCRSIQAAMQKAQQSTAAAKPNNDD